MDFYFNTMLDRIRCHCHSVSLFQSCVPGVLILYTLWSYCYRLRLHCDHKYGIRKINLYYYMMLQFFISSACLCSLIFQVSRHAEHKPVTESQIQGFCRPKGIHGFKSHGIKCYMHCKNLIFDLVFNSNIWTFFNQDVFTRGTLFSDFRIFRHSHGKRQRLVKNLCR